MKRFVLANGDKPHRCPCCHSIPDSASDGGARWWRTHSCDVCDLRWWRGLSSLAVPLPQCQFHLSNPAHPRRTVPCSRTDPHPPHDFDSWATGPATCDGIE